MTTYKAMVESNTVRKLRSINLDGKQFHVFTPTGLPVDVSVTIQEKAEEIKDRILILKKGFSLRIPGTNYIVKVV